MEKRPIRATLRRYADQYPSDFDRFAIAVAQMEGWGCQHEPEVARKRLLRILNSTGPGHVPRNFDADWAYMAPDFFPDDNVAQLHVRRAAVAQVRREEAELEVKTARRVA